MYNQGKRPAINPYLSVTRVGHQAQSPLFKDASRQLSRFLARHRRLSEFTHFGAELGAEIKAALALGARIMVLLNQDPRVRVDPQIGLILLASLWAGRWKDTPLEEVEKEIGQIVQLYETNATFRSSVEARLKSMTVFQELVDALRTTPMEFKK